MATVESVVTKALRLIRVVDVKQSVKAVDMQTGIEALNDMMTQWESFPLALGWSNVSNPSEEMPVGDYAKVAIQSNLALYLRPEYGVEAEADVIALATNSLAVLRRQYSNANPLSLNLSLPASGYGASFRRGTIESGY